VAPAVFKTVAGRLASRVGSIPIHSRHGARRRIVRDQMPLKTHTHLAARRLALVALALAAGIPPAAQAQRTDTARAGATPAPARPPRAPLSPRRAFVASLVAPGYAQSVLGRPNAAALFIVTEAVALLMVRETTIELRQARRLQDDSVALYFVNPQSGARQTIYRPARYPSALVRSRRAHLEDWIAALVANHVIAAADAFVAAHLWDVPVQVGFHSNDDRSALSVRFHW
jgi:hypothetical protein